MKTIFTDLLLLPVLLLLVQVLLSSLVDAEAAAEGGESSSPAESGRHHKIAVIGGAVTGSFVTKYLADYDSECDAIESITVFEPEPLRAPITVDHPKDDDWQASRVQTLKLSDGTIVELGASIGFRDMHLVQEMISNDDSLVIGRPFNTGDDQVVDEALHKGMGIYDGGGEFKILTSNKSSYWNKIMLMWRYNWDLIAVNRVCSQMLEGFAKLPLLMSSADQDTFFDSPDEVWDSIGLKKAVHTSFDDLLDSIGIPNELPAWRQLLPLQGSLRQELLTAINLVNYNQDNTQVNGIVGLGSFAASSGGIWSINGGNVKIQDSAYRQAHRKSQEACGGKSRIAEVHKRVTTVVGSLDGLTLYSDDETLGTYDIVVLAAPMQQSRVEFLIQSHMDDAVLQPMPFGPLVQPEDSETDDGHPILPSRILESAARPYTQVVTTVVSNATLSTDYFSISDADLPRSLLMTSAGKASLYNITAITQLKSSGVYKMFSNDKLSKDILTNLFGDGVVVEYVKYWGGKYGGATPDYRGKGAAQGFLLYDGALGIEGATNAGAVYYPSAMEQSSLACMEISALGARAVAKLIARRLGLVEVVQERDEARDEL